MRILIINSMFVNAIYRRCADELGRLPGVELTVLTTDGWVMNGKPMPLDRVEPNAPYSFIAASAGWKGKENRGFYRRGLIKALQLAKPDIIYLMEEPFSVFATQILLAKKMVCPRVPVLFFTWNNLSLTDYDYRPSVAYRNFAKRNLRSLDSAVTANSAGIAVLRDFGYSGPIETLGYGVDTAHYATPRVEAVRALRQSLGIADAEQVVGYVGRMIHMKGLDLLLDSFTTLSAEHPKLRLLLVGSGDLDAEIDSVVRTRSLSERVIRVPVVPHQDVPDYMHALDILVLPSRRVGMWAEQFGRVLVEAMAARKVVIGSSSGAIPEVIGDAGFVFRENDSESLTSKLSEALALSNGQREALVTSAYHRATETYSWKRFAMRSYEQLQQTVERSGNG